MNKRVVIWGAGRIGRGFASEIFSRNGYELNFWDKDQSMISALKQRGRYTVYKLHSEQDKEKVIISGYKAYGEDEKQEFMELMSSINLVVLSVFPAAFDSVAQEIVGAIKMRMDKGATDKLDVILCANMLHAGSAFNKALQAAAGQETRAYINENVGICESIVLRMAVDPTEDMKKEDPLVVATNGYPTLTVDETSLKGEKPHLDGLGYTEDFGAWEKRKLYTYNMLHAMFAYTGSFKGYEYVYECTNDEDIMHIVNGALSEVAKALQKMHGFSPEEMGKWNEECINNMKNPLLKDKLKRVGSDPVRRLIAGDRLAGPALMCKHAGVMPYFITKAIAYAFLYKDSEDASAVELNMSLKRLGIKAAAMQYCGFKTQPELAQLVTDRFEEAVSDPKAALKEDEATVTLYKSAWERGFYHESTIKGCAQCAMLAIKDVCGLFDERVFEAATAFSAGMSLCGDSACGGYSGGLMVIGLVYKRGLEEIEKKDKAGQYKAYELGQVLHDMFTDCYGSVICKDLHNCIFCRSYTLRIDEEKQLFEEAGAHADKCTSVVAMSSYMFVKMLKENTDILKEDSYGRGFQ